MTRLVINLFGPFQVRLDGRPITRFESDKVRALLAYLAVEADRPHRREQLAGLFWPDQPESAARHNLSQSLLRLRQAIDDYQARPPFLHITFQTIQFNMGSDVWLDVAAFRSAAAAATTAEALAQAVAYYTDDLLIGFYGVDSDLFEAWLLTKREELQRQALAALERLIGYYEERSDFESAQQAARRQLDLNPVREAGHRHLMSLLARQGRRSEALAQYQICRRILTEELGVEPAPETRALYEAIKANQIPFQVQGQTGQQTTPVLPPSSSPQRGENLFISPSLGGIKGGQAGARIDPGEMPEVSLFYGRKAERRQLTDWLLTDRCRLIAVLGIGGVGKTSLAARVVSAVSDQFDAVIWRSLLNAPPLAEILQAWLDFLADQPMRGLPDRPDEQIRLLLELLRRRRCLLILDNVESIMQAGDQAGYCRPGYEAYGQLWQRLGESAHQSCLLLTSREKPHEFSRMERRQGPVRSQQLAGLSLAAGQQILHEERLPGTADQLDRLLDRYSGNPLALRLVTETIRELFGGSIALFLNQPGAIFDDVEAVLDQQFVRLSSLERELMTWLAIEREAMTPQTLGENLVQAQPAGAVLVALRSLGRRSLIEQRGAAFTLQNVIIEYTTGRLVNQICQEVVALPPAELGDSSFNRYAMIKAQARAYIQQSQRRLILQPIAEYLVARLGQAALEARFRQLLLGLQQAGRQRPGYAAGNILNLLLHLNIDYRGYDFAGLCVWQADLQGKTVQAVNFTGADLRGLAFTHTLGAITCVAFSPDGQLLAAGTDDRLILLWQTTTGRLIAVLRGHADFVNHLAFSPDGTRLASGSGDRIVCLWDVRQPSDHSRPLKTFQGYSYDVLALNFNPTGRLLATVSVDCIRLWNIETDGEEFFRDGFAGRVETMAWSPDGRWLAVNVDEVIEVWDAAATLAAQVPQVQQRLHGHQDLVRRLVFSPDSQYLISSSEDRTLRLWRLADSLCLQTIAGHNSSVRGAAIDPGGTIIASSGADHLIHLWAAPSGERLKTLHGHTQTVMSVAFTPDGQTLASGGADHTVRLWDVQSGHLLNVIQGHNRIIHAVAFSPQGDHYACAVEDGSARVWDARGHRERWALHGHQGLVWRVVFSPDGQLLASGGFDGAVCLWSVSTGQLIARLPSHAKRLSSIAFNADGRILASSGYGGNLRLWDLDAGQILDTWQHPKRLCTLAFHPRQDLLAASCDDRLIYLWDTSQRRLVRTLAGHRYEAWGLCFSPDGSRLASSSDDQTIRLWDPATGACQQVLTGHTGTVQSLAFHPHGALLASASQDRTIRLWDVSAAGRAGDQPVLTLEGHEDRVTGLAFNPDGGRLLSGSSDETMRLWDLERGVCLETIRIPGPYAGMQIAGVEGLTPAQIANLSALGALS